jgi:hypothetical protein
MSDFEIVECFLAIIVILLGIIIGILFNKK